MLYFLVGLAVNAWFHSMDYRNYWLADAVYWLGLGILFLAAARLWAARPYLSLWLAGMFLWLAVVQWIRLPYWAVGFGWLALGIYFGCYLPVFIGLSRFGVHVLRLPVILVAPLVYTGLELAQGHLLTGMTMGCLEHSQYRGTMLIQISDLTGCYGVTFLMIFVAACLARMIPCETPVSSSRGVDLVAGIRRGGAAGGRAGLRPIPHDRRENRAGLERRLGPRLGRCSPGLSGRYP